MHHITIHEIIHPINEQDANDCTCPDGQALSNAGSGGKCLTTDGNVCKTNADCLSGQCDNTSKCASACQDPETWDPIQSACVCRAGYYATGNTCVACVEGSTTRYLGATDCTCWYPSGSYFDRSANVCVCPPDQARDNFGACKTANTGSCVDGVSCVSGLCQAGVCVAECDPATNSEPDGAGSCQCKAGYFGPSGQGNPACLACGGGSTSEPGSDVCKCAAPATWSPSTNTCTCPPGETYASGGCQCAPTVCSTACLAAPSPVCSDPLQSCEAGRCVPNKPSLKCIGSRGECGACVSNCGRDTSIVCNEYGLPGCKVNARGGGGRCAGTLVCCVISKPHPITPRADGRCA